ncbi:MAG: hypothetical protein RIF33_20250 [Cyclobacteriaceae bacterium]
MIERKDIHLKIFLPSSPTQVYWYISTDAGREKFWVEKSTTRGDLLLLEFPNGMSTKSEVLSVIEDKLYEIDYFGSNTTFELEEHLDGTTVHVRTAVSPDEFTEVHSGWTSVLLNLKAVILGQTDLRNHHPIRNWDNQYVDN